MRTLIVAFLASAALVGAANAENQNWVVDTRGAMSPDHSTVPAGKHWEGSNDGSGNYVVDTRGAMAPDHSKVKFTGKSYTGAEEGVNYVVDTRGAMGQPIGK